MPVAQINVARFRVPKADPANADFMAALDSINAQADAADGFIWRLADEGGNATEIAAIPDDPDFIVNMSVWRDVAALEAFAYRHPEHRAVLSRRGAWFDPMEPAFALWPVAEGHIPDVAEGMAMLDRLRREGPGKDVFTFAWYRANRRKMDTM